MDMIRYLNIFAVFFPFIYGIFLLVFKISLININKKILNNGLIFINLFSLIVFSYGLYLAYNGSLELNLTLPFIKTENFLFNFEFAINKSNIVFLFYSSLIAFIFSIYLKLYFKKFKQYIFTKQTYLNIFAFSTSVLYFFILSCDILSALIFWIALSNLTYLSSAFDLNKNSANINCSRFSKIASTGNFAFLTGVLLLLKYNFLQNGIFRNLTFNDFTQTINTIHQISSVFDLRAIILLLSLAFLTRFYIFPFASYISFLSNSSNLVYLNVIHFVNFISGIFLFKNIIPLFIDSSRYNFCVLILCAITIITSLIFILFEKNIKIICGYLFASSNALFLSSYIYFQNNIVIYTCLLINLSIFIALAFVFYQNKNEFSKRLIKKRKGFLLEKIYIITYEKFPFLISKIIDFIDKKIIQNIAVLFVSLVDFIIVRIFLRTQKIKYHLIIKYILMIFALIAVVAISIALFGGNNVK